MSTATLTLTEFVERRLGEWEAATLAAHRGSPRSPLTRLVAVCATMIERAGRETGRPDDPAAIINKAQSIVAQSTLRALAQIWAGHEEFDPAWAVGA